MTAHEIIAAALEDVRANPDKFRSGHLFLDGRMCVLGFLNKAAGRTRYNAFPTGEHPHADDDYMVYPEEAVEKGVLTRDDPLVVATDRVAECAIEQAPSVMRADATATVFMLNDLYGYRAAVAALECAKEKTR